VTTPTHKKKLIEVALPLEAINAASAREKSIRHGHPSTLHLWWARRPLAACRAVLFASLVDDPSEHPDKFPTEEDQAEERGRLFKLIEQLVLWENTTNEQVLNQAREEILKSTGGNPPPVLDPFCGGGSIPLEAQRLGLEAHGSDLNPVAVLITKALIEIPPRFAGQAPVNPGNGDSGLGSGGARGSGLGIGGTWKGAAGLAADVRYYGQWMRDEAEKRIGHMYPKITPPPTPQNPTPNPATVIAWLWARTVSCPNPACGARMPLVRSFALSTKKGKEAWVEPIVDQASKTVRFEVRTGSGDVPVGTMSRKGATCLVCGTPVSFEQIRAAGLSGDMSQRLLAVVAQAERGRVYLSPTDRHEEIAKNATPTWKPEAPLPENTRDIRPQLYGLPTYGDLFTDRQLVALTTFSDLVGEARERVEWDALAAGLTDDGVPLNDGGSGARAYADAVATYLALGANKAAQRNCVMATWESKMDRLGGAFGRQAIPMAWDFAETNPIGGFGGDIYGTVRSLSEVIDRLVPTCPGFTSQADAPALSLPSDMLFATDPPYYDNIGYGDLSDFFYVWLRRSVGDVYPDLFATLQAPKSDELIASPYRHDGDKRKAEEFFEFGLHRTFANIRTGAHPDYPVTIYYAFKQAEVERVNGDGAGPGVISSTGWETMLQGLLDAGFSITGTWPMRTELTVALKKTVSALASSIVLVCRPRPVDASIATRSDFLRALRRELPGALLRLQYGNIAPVDLAQAAIGPGMTIFSRYSKVLESSGEPMRVRTALQLINQVLDEVLAEQEGEFDGDTRWAITWFEQYGNREGPYGEAETLSKAKDTSIQGLVEAGILHARGGKVRLLGRDELKADWDPRTERRLTVWEVTQYLIRALEEQGTDGAAALVRVLGGKADEARDLSYRLYQVCERQGWAKDALSYNSLVINWPDIQARAGSVAAAQRGLGFGESGFGNGESVLGIGESGMGVG
jgi:putative DNA methylase